MKQNYFTYVLAALLLCFVSPAFAQVAKIGDATYDTFSEAIDAATAGQTITLIDDINGNVTIYKNLTIDGDGKNYTGTMNANNSLTVTVQNVNFVNGGFAKNNSGTTGTYTLKNCNFDGQGKYAYSVLANNIGTLNVEDCTVKNYLYSFLYVKKQSTNVSVKNVSVEDCPSYAVYFASGVTNATIEGLSVKNANNGIIYNNVANRTLSLKDCKMENVTTAINHAGEKTTKIITVNAEGENDFGTAGLSQYVKIAGAAAQLNGKFYASFDDAYKAAVKGDVITLLETAVISKNFTNYTKQITVKANFGATAFRVQGDAMMVTFGGMTIESNDYCITVGSKDGTTGANVDINGGTYKGSCTAISITKGDVRINDGTFSVEPYEGSYDYTINCIDAAYKNKDARISIKGGKFYNFDPANNVAEGAGTNFVTGGYTTAKDAEGWYTTAAAVAEVAGVKYISLADAVAAAEDGATIKLIPTTSYTNGAGVVINKNITIDFNGKTYTVNKAVGSKGTETLGFQILKGNNVTLKNGTLTSKAVTEGNQVKMLIQNYANLTLDNMNLEDATDHILYVLSNNCGETQLIGNTNITTDAVAFDSYKDNSYTAPTVTVETTGKIEGKIEKNDGATIAIKSGIFTTPIEAAWCAAGYAPAENGDGTYGVVFDPAYGKVAKIGDAYFETFAAAVAAATADQTITLIADVVEPKTVVFGKALKIDGADHTFKGAIEFNKSKASYTIKNVNFDGEGTRVYALKTTASTGTLTVENCTCKNYTYGFLHANKATANLNVKDVTVEGVNYGVHSVYGTNVTLENYKANNTAYAVYVQNYGVRNVTLNNCTFEGCENPLAIWERNQTNKITFTFKGVNDMGKAAFCTSGMAVIKATAMIGTKVYETLQAAVDAAQADETVTLLADAAGAGVVINKNIAIDFNGKTYTVNKAVGSKGTETLGFQILKNNSVTLKNGTLKSTTVVEGKEVKMLVQNYASLNLVDMNLVDETEHIQYVLSNNSGNTELSGNTNITTDAVAFDSYFSQSYTAPTVTVKTTGKIAGSIEKNDGATIAIENGTYTVDVTAWCAPGYMCVANGDGTYGITRANIQVGDKYFATMEEAIAAATANQTITLLADINESVTINKSLTIDGNGKNYTGTMTANANLTVTVKNTNFVNGGFAKTKSTNGIYTIVDCTFDGNGTYAYPLQFKGANTINVENCTVKNYLYSFLYVSHSATKVSVKNVTVEDCPNYAVYFASGVATATIEGLSVKNANNGIIYNNTANRTFSLKDCTMENVTTAIDHSKGTSTITVNAEGENDFGGAAISKYVQINGTVDGISNPVAKIGETEYNSLSEAFAAAQDGETVTLIENIDLTDEDVISAEGGLKTIYYIAGKNIIFDMNEKKISVAYNSGNYLIGVFCVADGAGLTVTGNGIIDIPQKDRQVAYMFIKRGTTGYLVIENGTFHAGNLEDSMIYTNGNNIVTVKGGTFTIDNIGERVNGCPWIFNAQGNNAKYINVTGGTYNWDIRNQNWAAEVKLAEGLTTIKSGENLWTVGTAVAEVNGNAYATLADAIEAAEENETVTLLADATGAGVVINKDVTIDFNTKTYTVNKAVGSKGTETLGFQILKGNDVTLENGTLTSTAVEEGNEVKMLIQNYADLSLVDMNLVDATDHILYVLSNNCGDSYVGGNTNITTDAVAFDSYKSKYYDAPMVTVETAGKITGAIEKNDGATIAIMSGTFTAEILPEWCAEYYVPVQNEDETWTVVNTYVEELTFVDGQFTKFENDIEKTVGTLTYERTLIYKNEEDPEWNAIYLPFEVPMSELIDNYEVAYFNDVQSKDTNGDGTVDDLNMELIRITSDAVSLRANYPYLIRAKNEEAKNLKIVLHDAKLYKAEENKLSCSSVFMTFEITGNNCAMSRNELGESLIVNTKGGWSLLSQTGTLKPWRLYLKITTSSELPWIESGLFDLEQMEVTMTVRGDDGGANGIENSKFELNVADSKYYDLMGRVVEHPVKGRIYIVNGKKVVY